MELSNKELGQYLKSVRDKLEYSIYDVNKLCGISPSYLSLMENGKRKPSATILKKLAPIYNLDYLNLYKKAGYLDLTQNFNNINIDGLDENDIEEINKFIEFLKNKKKK